jgi:hypothetical protein
MAEFRLDRFKYNWRSEWASSVSYRRDDIVRVNGKSYVCIITHVSSASFRQDLDAILPGSVPPQAQPRWTVMTNSFSFIGNWTTSIDYNLGDIVKYNGSLWLCTTNHLSTNFATDVSNWTTFSETASYQGDWASATDYTPGAIVSYNGNAHKCISAHTSQATLEDNSADWELYRHGYYWAGSWITATTYRLNDLVKYGGTVFRCIETHTSSGDALDDSKFQIEIFGGQYDGTWSGSTYYNIGDIVRHNGFVYYAIKNNFNSKPFTESGSTDWIIVSRGYNFVGDWGIDDTYKTGDLVLRGGNLYLALRDIGPEENLDGSSLDYLDPETWELTVPGIAWKGNWAEGTLYSIGDVIIWKGSSYSCNVEHTASFVNFPGDNGNAFAYWDLLIQAGQPAALSTKGDLLTFGLNRQVDQDGSTIFDDSTQGDTRLAIGEKEQILSVTSDLDLFWRNIVEDSDTIFVATNGIDAFNRGTFQKPFRTIKYAAEYVEDNYVALTPVIIRVSTGKFEEVSPIIVPAGCAINGDELRSTTVVASSANPLYNASYYTTHISAVNHFLSIVLNVLEGIKITPQTGNTKEQFYDTGDNQFLASDITLLDAIDALIVQYKNAIEFRILSGDVDPDLTGSNVENISDLTVRARVILDANKEFLMEEVFRYVRNNLPNVTNSEIQIKNDFWSLLRGILRDLKYTGNYGTIISAKSFANANTGSQAQDLFYMRDTTGLRDMTTGGLGGVLNPPGVFDLYQKPTGGALVSLDPGWGPEDERTWIRSRSPYIQGVTNTGTGCIGMKVDGALHNGGNKSMTANDFTQVLSDGIGMWITNNARAELVSVFTYYCQIGYFAEDGGIIRAANGNNSYGRYGSIADGIDDTEVPQVVAAFNRNNEALVSEAFAGGAGDELKIFEYSNCGQNYTEASAAITGAGANANVEFRDFRDGGIFEQRLISADGSSKAGGAGYLRRQGNAQEIADASVTIKLASTDVTQFESEILGMRLTVTDGTGVGQYGYITGFTFASKEATVARDSDDVAGWDHIIPGTPLVAAFDLTTRYRIEPRVTVPLPSYSTSSSDLFTNRSYVDMAFGNTTETFTGVQGGGNVIWRDDAEIRVTVKTIVSDIAIQFNGQFAVNPNVPFNIQGRLSGATATVTAITANTDTLIEVDVESGGNGFQLGEEIDLVLAAGTGDTFDGAPINAQFTVVKAGPVYNATLTSGGAGYAAGDKITILGTALGGATPANDMTITVGTVSDDSTSSILTFTSVGTGDTGLFVSLTSIENARYSENGTTWTEVALPFAEQMKSLITGNNRFIAVSENQSRVASSLNGITWSEVSLPLSAAWADGVYGGKFVIVATDTDTVVSSTDGVTWTASGIIPDDAGGLTSTLSTWTNITYGNGKYLAISSSDGATASSTDAITWVRHDEAISFNPDYIAYGANRFVAIAAADGESAYSFDGITWYTNSDTLSDLSSPAITFQPSNIKYANGVFVAIGSDSGSATTVVFTSEDGVLWTQRVMPASQQWSALTYGKNKWVAKSNAASTDAVAILNVGTRAKFRAEVSVGTISEIRVFDPGSGYDVGSPPTLTIVDPNVTSEVATESRIADGVVAQPDFVDRGAGYRSSTSTITITGNGFADVVPVGNTLTVSGITKVPGPGVQIKISGVVDPNALEPGTLAVFSGVTVKDLGDDGLGNETKLIEFQISPRLDVEYVVAHSVQITLQEQYSQCRISGHDFLDIGTGNFIQTNYPTVYADGAFFTASPENEVFESNGGRVYYVSTDQDGNFRTGELFSVQQATGIVTISAEFFDLDGLSELALGGVRLGGSGAVVNEFSTDATFSADSNNVIPTQKAIAAFLQNRLSVGGESLEVNKLQAGRVLVGGTPENEINMSSGQYLEIPADVVFDGQFTSDDGAGNVTTNKTEISGTIVSQMLMLKPFDETMQ